MLVFFRPRTKKPLPESYRSEASVPGAGIEPARPIWPQDFKSCVSTYSTIPAYSTASRASVSFEFTNVLK